MNDEVRKLRKAIEELTEEVKRLRESQPLIAQPCYTPVYQPVFVPVAPQPYYINPMPITCGPVTITSSCSNTHG